MTPDRRVYEWLGLGLTVLGACVAFLGAADNSLLVQALCVSVASAAAVQLVRILRADFR
jgi:hypothetical protein